MTKGGVVRAKSLFNTSTKPLYVYLISFDSAEEKSKFIELTGLNEKYMRRVSEINKVDNSPKILVDKNTDKAKCSVLLYDNQKSSSLCSDISRYWINSSVDIKEGGIYVLINRYKINNTHPLTYINSMNDHLNMIGEPTVARIIGVKSKIEHQFSSNDKWVTLENYCKKKVNEYLQKDYEEYTKMVEYLAEYQFLNINNSYLGLFRSLFGQTGIGKDHLISQTLKLMKQYEAYPSNYSQMLKIKTLMFFVGLSIDKNVIIKNMVDSIWELYPLVKDRYNNKGVDEYVLAMDLYRKSTKSKKVVENV
jgi:hypothetical protein